MRRRKTIFMLVACALIVVIASMTPLKCIQKLSNVCPFSHKLQIEPNPRLRDSVTSPDTTGMVTLPASEPATLEQIPIRLHLGITDFCRSTVNPLIEAPPLLC